MTGHKLFQEMKMTGLALFLEKKMTGPRLFGGLKIPISPYLIHLNFRAPLIFAQTCAKINGSENRRQIS